MMYKQIALLLLVSCLLVLVIPGMAQDDTSQASFEIVGTADLDRAITDASWYTEPNHSPNLRIGATFQLVFLEGPDRNAPGIYVTFSGIPTTIEAGEYELSLSSVGDGERGTPVISGDVTLNTGSGISFSSARSGSTLIVDSVEDGLFSGSFTLIEYEDTGTVTGVFTNIPIPTLEGCYIETDLEDEESDAVVSFVTQTTPDNEIADINVEAGSGYYAIAITDETIFDESFFDLFVASLPDEDGNFGESAVIHFRELPYNELEIGEIEIGGRDATATIEYLPTLGSTNRDLEGILIIAEMDEDTATISGSFELDILADDFFDDTEDPFGTVSGTFTNIPLPLPLDECIAESWQ